MATKLGELRDVPGFAETFVDGGRPHDVGARLRLPRLGRTLERLVDAGLDDFYRGELARELARELEDVGSPLRLADFERHQPLLVEPLDVAVGGHRVFNMPPPTQGLASLLLLATFARLDTKEPDGFRLRSSTWWRAPRRRFVCAMLR